MTMHFDFKKQAINTQGHMTWNDFDSDDLSSETKSIALGCIHNGLWLPYEFKDNSFAPLHFKGQRIFLSHQPFTPRIGSFVIIDLHNKDHSVFERHEGLFVDSAFGWRTILNPVSGQKTKLSYTPQHEIDENATFMTLWAPVKKRQMRRVKFEVVDGHLRAEQ